MQSNRFYFHTVDFKQLKKLCIPYFIVRNKDDFVFTQCNSLNYDRYILLVSKKKLDLSFLNGFRSSNIFCFCETGCCGYQIATKRFIDLFYTIPLSITDGGLMDIEYQSGFGHYIRDLFNQWIKITNYDRYILHGCEDESLRSFKNDKELLFYGLPKYNDPSVFFKSLIGRDTIKLQTYLDSTYGGRLKYDSFIHSDVDIDGLTTIESILKNFTNATIVNLHGSEKDIKYSFVPSNFLVIYLTDEPLKPGDIMHGFKNDLILSKSSILALGWKLIRQETDYFAYLSEKIILDHLIPNLSTRSVAQRSLIMHVDMFKAALKHQSSNEINIAIFVTDEMNFKHWRKIKPISNVIGTIANFDVAVSLGFDVKFNNRKGVYTDGEYTDLLVTSFDMFNYGYNYIPVSHFEILVYPVKYEGKQAYFHPSDYRKSLIGVFTDKDSDCNIQNIFTSSTFDLKSVTPLLLKSLSIRNDLIYYDRYLFLRSHLKSLVYKNELMWSVGYKKKESNLDLSENNIEFVDISGHFINFMIKANFKITDIKGHLNMVDYNINLENRKTTYFGIDISKYLGLTLFNNPESRTQKDFDALWHTVQECLAALHYSKIIVKQLKKRKSFDESVVKIESFLRSVKSKPDRLTGITVYHDENIVSEILVEISGSNQL